MFNARLYFVDVMFDVMFDVRLNFGDVMFEGVETFHDDPTTGATGI